MADYTPSTQRRWHQSSARLRIYPKKEPGLIPPTAGPTCSLAALTSSPPTVPISLTDLASLPRPPTPNNPKSKVVLRVPVVQRVKVPRSPGASNAHPPEPSQPKPPTPPPKQSYSASALLVILRPICAHIPSTAYVNLSDTLHRTCHRQQPPTPPPTSPAATDDAIGPPWSLHRHLRRPHRPSTLRRIRITLLRARSRDGPGQREQCQLLLRPAVLGG